MCVLLCTRSVVPLLSMSNSVLLCISTLLDGGNHYSKMFDLVDSVGASCSRASPSHSCVPIASRPSTVSATPCFCAIYTY